MVCGPDEPYCGPNLPVPSQYLYWSTRPIICYTSTDEPKRSWNLKRRTPNIPDVLYQEMYDKCGNRYFWVGIKIWKSSQNEKFWVFIWHNSLELYSTRNLQKMFKQSEVSTTKLIACTLFPPLQSSLKQAPQNSITPSLPTFLLRHEAPDSLSPFQSHIRWVTVRFELA